MQIYIGNPKAPHKAVADMHYRKFWASDPQWEGRSFSACQQRMIALNNKSRDRPLLPAALAEMESAADAADNADDADTEAGHGTVYGRTAPRLLEKNWDDGEAVEAMGGDLRVAQTISTGKGKQRMAAGHGSAQRTENYGMALGNEQYVEGPQDGPELPEENAEAEYDPSAADAARLLLTLSGR